MRSSTSALSLLAILSSFSPASATYNLKASYTAANLLSSFTFFTGSDPTHGDVQYVAQSVAQNAGLVGTTNNQVYLGVDYKTVNPPAGRQSVRLSSNTAWNKGIFAVDIAHMPAADCGVWPAFWMFGPNWPNSGEIDILEGVNQGTTNQVTLHTAAGCTVSGTNSAPGSVLTNSNCNANNGNNGCPIVTTNTGAYGNGLNAQGGGVYAMQWESSGIYVWFFPRNAIPAGFTSGNPTPATWGQPMASFSSAGCNFDTFFANQNIVFDTTFCGDWAGSVWASSSCASKAATCNAYVNANPGVFSNAYWAINWVKVFQQ